MTAKLEGEDPLDVEPRAGYACCIRGSSDQRGVDRSGEVNVAKTHALLFCLAAGVVSNGCDRVSGVGRLDGVNGQASWGIVADGCDVPGSIGQVQYDDHDEDIKFHADVISVRHCVMPTDCVICDAQRVALGIPITSADYEVLAEYRSTNPAVPGSGQTVFCLTDNGEGTKATASDNGIVSVETGPYAGYLNYGPVRGNIQQHQCPATQ